MTRFPKSTTLSPHARAANLAAVMSGENGCHALSDGMSNSVTKSMTSGRENRISHGMPNGLSSGMQHNIASGVSNNISKSMGNSFSTEISNGIQDGQLYELYGDLGTEGNVDLLLSSLEFEFFERARHNWPGIQMPDILWPELDSLCIDRSLLEQRASDIRQALYRTATSQAVPNLPPTEVVEAINHLSADKIVAFIKLYFRHWHKHGPIVYEHSFNPCMAAVPLVLALMALGAMVSSFLIKDSL